MTNEDFKLTDAERHSAAWTRIKEHLEDRLDAHRRKNDGNLSQDETAKLRGRIAEMVYTLGLGETEPPDSVADHGE